MKTKTPPKYKSGETVIYQGSQYRIVDSYLADNGYRYDLGTPANRSIAENELALDHKFELNRLYSECDRAFGDEWHKAFDKLSEYVELHNLTLLKSQKSDTLRTQQS